MTLAQPQTLSTKELLGSLVFHNYAERKPEKGLCIWRMAHGSKKFEIVFTAEMRIRGAGFKNVLSPEFDYWDGYRVILPKGLIEWAENPVGMSLPGVHRSNVLEIVGVEHENCPFCKNQPKWETSGGFIGSTPVSDPYFHLTCCKWFNGKRNSSSDPLALAAARNAAITG
jgi:hypothetical protein